MSTNRARLFDFMNYIRTFVCSYIQINITHTSIDKFMRNALWSHWKIDSGNKNLDGR